MNKKLEKLFVDFWYERGEYEGRPLGIEQYISFIDTHFIAKEEVYTLEEEMEQIKGLYTKQEVLDIIGEDRDCEDRIHGDGCDCEIFEGYRQAKKEIRERIN